jgi:hypothetical protein
VRHAYGCHLTASYVATGSARRPRAPRQRLLRCQADHLIPTSTRGLTNRCVVLNRWGKINLGGNYTGPPIREGHRPCPRFSLRAPQADLGGVPVDLAPKRFGEPRPRLASPSPLLPLRPSAPVGFRVSSALRLAMAMTVPPNRETFIGISRNAVNPMVTPLVGVVRAAAGGTGRRAAARRWAGARPTGRPCVRAHLVSAGRDDKLVSAVLPLARPLRGATGSSSPNSSSTDPSPGVPVLIAGRLPSDRRACPSTSPPFLVAAPILRRRRLDHGWKFVTVSPHGIAARHQAGADSVPSSSDLATRARNGGR